MNYGWFVRLDNRAGHYVLLAACAATLFFLNLGGPTLWDIDEGRNATCSLEMMEADQWIKPTFNAELRVDKPALLYWLQRFAYWLFEVNEFAARFPSALAGLLTLFVAYELGRQMFGPSTGLLTGLVTATTPMLCAAARFANPDALLNLFTCLNLLIFWQGLATRSWRWFAALGLSAGLAVLAKGPVGVVLPSTVAFLFLFWTGQLSVIWDRRWWLAFWVFFVVAMPWYILVAAETKGDFLRGFFLKHNVGRFLAPMETHGAGPFFYVIVLAFGFAPWSVFLPLAAWPALLSIARTPPVRWREAHERLADRAQAGSRVDAYRLLWCWAIVFVAFYSFSATKLPNYVLPAVLPLAVFVARFWDRWRTGEISVPAWTLNIGVAWLGVCGLFVSAGLLAFGGGVEINALRDRHVPGLGPWAALGLVPVVCAIAGLWLLHRQQRQAFVPWMIVSFIVFLTPVVAWALTTLNQVKAARPLIETAGADRAWEDIRLATYQLDYYPSLNFYSRREVRPIKGERDADDFFKSPFASYLFLPENRFQDLKRAVSRPLRVIARHPDIYRGNDVLVVTNR